MTADGSNQEKGSRETPPESRAPESRWPMAIAVVTAIAMQFSLPDRHVLSPTLLFPVVESLLLVVLLSRRASPRIDWWSTARSRIIIGLVIVLSADNLLAVVELVRDILDGSKNDNGTVLLATGAAIWWSNVVAFSLWFWMVDRGGPTARAVGREAPPSFLFSAMQGGDFAPAAWEPQYLDYLYLAFTNATAFSPTDTLPLTRWAKTLMLVQSAISLVVALMVIARAVNILN